MRTHQHRNWIGMIAGYCAVVLVTSITFATGPITHFVSVGGPDIIGPGGDKNISFVAMEKDGVVTGKFTDMFAAENGGGGFKADINCLSVTGNEAWIRGTITNGSINGTDVTGYYVYSRVKDNGTSANDPPDQVSYTIHSTTLVPCQNHAALNFVLYDMPQGQVTVR